MATDSVCGCLCCCPRWLGVLTCRTEYSRTGNPTRNAFEKAVAAAEGGAHCLAYASGMAAISACVHLLKTGDHILCVRVVSGWCVMLCACFVCMFVCLLACLLACVYVYVCTCVWVCSGGRSGVCVCRCFTVSLWILLLTPAACSCVDDLYGGTQRYLRTVVAPTYGVTFSMVDLCADGEAVLDEAVTPATRMLWLESPTNPTLKVVDIAALCLRAKKHGLIVVVDNTFMSPYFQQPLSLGACPPPFPMYPSRCCTVTHHTAGADVSMHSVTKYINGHSDVVGGVVITVCVGVGR